MSAKLEIEKSLTNKLIVSTVADRIIRHLNLEEIPPRGFRLPQRSNSSETCK